MTVPGHEDQTPLRDVLEFGTNRGNLWMFVHAPQQLAAKPAIHLGAGNLMLCRPNRPGRNYNWRREGNREGWYDRRARTWHFDRW
jgi:hypothetical protein